MVIQLSYTDIWTSKSQNHITVNCKSASEVFTLWETLQCWVRTAIWGIWSMWLRHYQNVLQLSSGCCTTVPTCKANSWWQQRPEMAIKGCYCYYETSELHDLWTEMSKIKLKVKQVDEFIYWLAREVINKYKKIKSLQSINYERNILDRQTDRYGNNAK